MRDVWRMSCTYAFKWGELPGGSGTSQRSCLHGKDTRVSDGISKKSIVLFVRDGGDGLGVSQTAAILAPEYGITYRTPMFAIHKNGRYRVFRIVGKGFDDLKEYHQLVKEVRALRGNFVKVMFSGIMDFSIPGMIHRHASCVRKRSKR